MSPKTELLWSLRVRKYKAMPLHYAVDAVVAWLSLL